MFSSKVCVVRWSTMIRPVNITRFSSSTTTAMDVKAETPEEKHAFEQSKMVAAAFASLKEISSKRDEFKNNKTASFNRFALTSKTIATASDIETLLSVTDENIINRRHALRVISILAEWANTGKVKLSDFEGDARFIRLCRLLTKKGDKGGQSSDQFEDLSVVLGVTADDQAAKLISSINLAQMVRVISSLAVKNRRSTPLLRSLSFNIGRSTETLDLKQAADVLYACGKLNFPDEVLLEKITADILTSLKNNRKSAVISSIVTSVGILKYRDTDLLEALCVWMVEKCVYCRPKEFLNLIVTLANLNYVPSKFSELFQIIRPTLNERDMNNIVEWLRVVWSLVILKKGDEELMSSVLQPNFIQNLKKLFGSDGNEEFLHPIKLKLLNINGAAMLLKDKYKGPLLQDEDIFQVPITRTKEKQHVVDCIFDALSNISPSDLYYKTNVNTGMGFLIDMECRIDSNGKLQPLQDEENGENTKVAIIAATFHDMCRGSHYELTGISALSHRLLRESGFKVISVPYTEFTPMDKLMQRVRYLERKLKSVNEGVS